MHEPFLIGGEVGTAKAAAQAILAETLEEYRLVAGTFAIAEWLDFGYATYSSTAVE